MLLVMFYGIITPVAAVVPDAGTGSAAPQARGRRGTTFWLPKQTPQDVRSYFRQY